MKKNEDTSTSKDNEVIIFKISELEDQINSLQKALARLRHDHMQLIQKQTEANRIILTRLEGIITNFLILLNQIGLYSEHNRPRAN